MAKEKMNVTIDRDGCIGCGVCWSTCPDVFEQNQDDTHSQIVNKYRTDAKLGEGEIPKELEGCASNAADGCPVQVIRVE